VSALIRLATDHDCPTIAVEDLNFANARATGRETMGHGRKGKTFRATVAGLPTAQSRDRLAGMAYHAGVTVVAVDPAYTSRWGRQHWPPTQAGATLTVTRQGSTRRTDTLPDRSTASGHHAAVVIGRRALGHPARRNAGGARPDQRNSVPASRPTRRPAQPGRRQHSTTGQGQMHPTDRPRTPTRMDRRDPVDRHASP